jgi:hypothetical protein
MIPRLQTENGLESFYPDADAASEQELMQIVGGQTTPTPTPAPIDWQPLAQQITQRWQGRGINPEIKGINRANELAQILSNYGISDLSKIGIKQTPYEEMRGQNIGGESGEYIEELYKGNRGQLTYGDQTFGRLGGFGSKGGQEFAAPQEFLTEAGDGRYGLAYSAAGKGWTDYEVVVGPDGAPEIVPKWGSSSDITPELVQFLAIAAMPFTGGLSNFLAGTGLGTVGGKIAANALISGGLGGLGAEAQGGSFGEGFFKSALPSALGATVGHFAAPLASSAASSVFDATKSQLLADAAKGAITGAARALPGAAISGSYDNLLTSAVAGGASSAVGNVFDKALNADFTSNDNINNAISKGLKDLAGAAISAGVTGGNINVINALIPAVAQGVSNEYNIPLNRVQTGLQAASKVLQGGELTPTDIFRIGSAFTGDTKTSPAVSKSAPVPVGTTINQETGTPMIVYDDGSEIEYIAGNPNVPGATGKTIVTDTEGNIYRPGSNPLLPSNIEEALFAVQPDFGTQEAIDARTQELINEILNAPEAEPAAGELPSRALDPYAEEPVAQSYPITARSEPTLTDIFTPAPEPAPRPLTPIEEFKFQEANMMPEAPPADQQVEVTGERIPAMPEDFGYTEPPMTEAELQQLVAPAPTAPTPDTQRVEVTAKKAEPLPVEFYETELEPEVLGGMPMGDTQRYTATGKLPEQTFYELPEAPVMQDLYQPPGMLEGPSKIEVAGAKEKPSLFPEFDQPLLTAEEPRYVNVTEGKPETIEITGKKYEPIYEQPPTPEPEPIYEQPPTPEPEPIYEQPPTPAPSPAPAPAPGPSPAPAPAPSPLPQAIAQLPKAEQVQFLQELLGMSRADLEAMFPTLAEETKAKRKESGLAGLLKNRKG